MRALGHAPYVLGRKALLAQGRCLSLLQLCSAKWWIISKLSLPNAQEAEAWHSEAPGPRSRGTSLSAMLSSICHQWQFPAWQWEEARRWGARQPVPCSKHKQDSFKIHRTQQSSAPQPGPAKAREESCAPAHLGGNLDCGQRAKESLTRPTAPIHSHVQSINQYSLSTNYVPQQCSVLPAQKWSRMGWGLGGVP